MKWLFAEVKRGHAYPNEAFWHDKADTLIPLPNSIFHHDYKVPEDRIILYSHEAIS